MSRAARSLLAAVVPLAAALAAAAAPPAPPEFQASLALEPPRLLLGQVARAEIAVSTPPGHRLRPPRLPELPGLWVVEQRSLPIERQPGRWVHRALVRVRARELGATAFPALRLEVETPGGEVHELGLDERPLEVVSVVPELPARDAPFGLAAPAGRPPGPAGWLGPAAAGAAAALAAAAAVTLLRTRARRRAGATRSAPLAPAWDEAHAALAEAVREAAADPRAAADRAAAALRRYAARRFGGDATTRTAEELAAELPPWSARELWPDLAALVRRLDDARFRAGAPPADALAAALGDAVRFVRDTTPPEARR
jgi:hypothetical protein